MHAPFAPVARPAETSRIAGVDVRDFHHSISNQVVRHVARKHPNVAEKDYARLPRIVQVTPELSAERGMNGVPRLLYRARVDGVEYGYVVEVRRRAMRLDAFTFYRV